MEISTIIESKMAKTISDLYPYTEYTLYIHCSLPGCYGGWGLFGGPVTMRTNEEGKNFYYFLDMCLTSDVMTKNIDFRPRVI